MATETLPPGFWEIGRYKHNVKRIKDGIDQLDEFSKMARERAEIEAKYSKMLMQFSEKWKAHVEKTVHPGCVKTAWTKIIGEAESLSYQHANVKDRLVEDIVRALNSYRKDNHHPSTFRGSKETKEIEEGFEKSQKQWKKLHDKMESAKRTYYSACRQEGSAAVNFNNSQADSSMSSDHVQKLRDRLEKYKEEVSKTKNNYEKSIEELTKYRTPYIENMSFVFEKCQQMEFKRSKFFVETMLQTQNVLSDLLTGAQICNTHSDLERTIKMMDEQSLQKDLKNWSEINGTDAQTDWPSFKEYSPEMRMINKSGGKASDGVVLTRSIVKTDDVIAGPATTISIPDSSKGGSDSDTNTFDSRKAPKHQANDNNVKSKEWSDRGSSASPTSPDSAKYGDFDDFPPTHVVKSNATVLYDYKPLESDEIPLKKGEVIEVLSEPDSLGWCTGRRNGEVGLFPASYVDVM